MSICLSREDIKALIPHREPMLLLDYAERLDDGSGIAEYTIREDDFFCVSLADGTRVVPAPIICEIMAQSCVTVAYNVIHNYLPLYASMNNVVFNGVVRPGDKCDITTQLIFNRGNLYQCKISLRVCGELRCEGEFACALVPKEVQPTN